MSQELKDVLEFGPYRIDLDQRLLKKGNDVIPLAPKVLETLIVLVENHGRVLEKEYLLKKVWPDTFVEEGSLTRNISTLRKALGHSPDDENYIATVPKRGYRFGATITKIPNGHTDRGESTAPRLNSSAPAWGLPLWPITALAVLLAIVFAALYFRKEQRLESKEHSVSFLVSPPENVASGRAALAVSPDGEKLAFGGIDPDGKMRLWVRPLASLTADPIPGSDGAVSVFWSPDSRSIAFFAGGKLKRSDLSGAPPQILCDASDANRPIGTWGRDGVILFNSDDRRGLYRVPASGGEATQVTAFDTSRQENLHAWPQFLPDGRHFIYLIQSDKPENTGIYAASLDSKVAKQVVNTSTNPLYAVLPSGIGYLLYMHTATLMARQFDAKKLELQGEEFPVADQVLMPPAPARGFAAFSASATGVLAYRTRHVAMTELVWFDRRGHRLGTVGEPGTYSVPALSPNENILAITRTDMQLGTRNIWLFDLEGGAPSRFTFEPTEETNPTWSPDSKQIAYSSSQNGHHDIYQKAATGVGEARPLMESREIKLLQSWTPDGRTILYDSAGKLWAQALSGNQMPIVVFTRRGGEARAVVSPDMKWMAYQSGESGRTEVYIQSFPMSGSKWQVSTGGGEEPYWRRDGKELFFVAGKQLMALEIKAEGQALSRTIPKSLFEVHLEMDDRRSRYQVAANGHRFLVNVPLASTVTAPITMVISWTAGLKR